MTYRPRCLLPRPWDLDPSTSLLSRCHNLTPLTFIQQTLRVSVLTEGVGPGQACGNSHGREHVGKTLSNWKTRGGGARKTLTMQFGPCLGGGGVGEGSGLGSTRNSCEWLQPQEVAAELCVSSRVNPKGLNLKGLTCWKSKGLHPWPKGNIQAGTGTGKSPFRKHTAVWQGRGEVTQVGRG